MGKLTQKDIDNIFEELELSKPKITFIQGINNKQSYFQADNLYNILRKYRD